jgi:hypothetical protein
VRELAVNWYSFRDNTTLRRWTQQVLVELLLEQSIEFQLTPAEIVQLQTLRAAEKADEPTSAHQEAGHSAVILSPERYIPSEGRLIGDPPANS